MPGSRNALLHCTFRGRDGFTGTCPVLASVLSCTRLPWAHSRRYASRGGGPLTGAKLYNDPAQSAVNGSRIDDPASALPSCDRAAIYGKWPFIPWLKPGDEWPQPLPMSWS
jgi:hypothetical protein